MEPDKVVQMVVRLTELRDGFRASFDSGSPPWADDATSFADAAYEHVDRALEATITVALASGVTVAALEAATGHPVLQAEWFSYPDDE